MTNFKFSLLMLALLAVPAGAHAQSADACNAVTKLDIKGVEITKSEFVPAGTTIPAPYPGAPAIGPLPAHCRVDGVINRRNGVGGQEFGIGFALALPQPAAWNGDFMMQGGGGGNGFVAYPTGSNYAGDTPALTRGFAVASTDTGHRAKTGPFDFSFMRDQQAYLDFAFLANAEVAVLAKQIIERYYAKPPAYSYFVGCSTGGREGMILSQRYPAVFNGIVSGDPAMRTGLSNLTIAQWIPVAYNQAAPKDAIRQAADRSVPHRRRAQDIHGWTDEALRRKRRSCRWHDFRSSGVRFRSRSGRVQIRRNEILHRARKSRGHQKGLCGTEERVRNTDLSRLPVRRGNR